MKHVKHKHADHIIIIEDHAFKANADGMWNLTEIWKVLGLPNNKLPSQWRGKITKRLADMQKMHVEKIGIEKHNLCNQASSPQVCRMGLRGF